MRLVYVHNSPVPNKAASTVQVMRMCSAFTRLGHDVELIVPVSGTEAAPTAKETADYYGCAGEFAIHRIPLGRAGWFGFAYHAAQRAKAVRADLVYGRCVRSCAAAAMRGMQVMHEAHGPLEAYSRSGQLAFAYLARSSRLRRLVVINQALADYYAARFATLARPPLVAPSATDPVSSFPPLRPFPEGGRLRIGYVGSLHPGKGMELIAELARRTDHEFIVAGGDDESIARWKSQLGSRVNFLGHVPNRDVSAIIGSFDIALAPYLTSISGAGTRFNLAQWMSPLKLFEYMAHGRPIITSDLPSIREIVQDGVEAMLCDPAHPDQWIATAERLAGDFTLRQRLGAAALEAFRASHEWSGRAKLIIAATAAQEAAA
ncbi:glycosyltransferase family 4 protein [Sphingomonas sp. ZT3P38]|uniref:glycosyltransferase family 4 protein n=1 Tax=Parasphingomonas zepuensis TaxID=3096161 RepID=UPI002FC5E3DB